MRVRDELFAQEAGLKELSPVIDRSFWDGEDDVAIGVGKPCDEALAFEPGDPFGGEVDDGYHLAADEVGGAVVDGDLGAGGAGADFSEVDEELVGGFARAFEGFCRQDGADSGFDLLKVFPCDGVHGRSMDVLVWECVGR